MTKNKIQGTITGDQVIKQPESSITVNVTDKTNTPREVFRVNADGSVIIAPHVTYKQVKDIASTDVGRAALRVMVEIINRALKETENV